jgi:hypothetical protein
MIDAPDYTRLPARVRAVIDRCRQGETLCKSLRRKETGETEINFYFEPSGRKAGPRSSQDATKTPFLVPNNDGLLDAGSSQTWRAA